jgi:HEAT repeat protein
MRITKRALLLSGVGSGLMVVGVWWCAAGCAPRAASPETGTPQVQAGVREDALEALRAAATFEYNPLVRVQALEAYATTGIHEALPWVREALHDEHPGVRFAACMAIGDLEDAVAHAAVVERLEDEDYSVRVGACYALHRLGDDQHTGWLATWLIQHEDPKVRANAAIALGRFPEHSVVKMLARAMNVEPDEQVQEYLLEAMARHHQPESIEQLRLMANSGIGRQELMAINALSETGQRRHEDIYRYKLESALHLETRLAAARALGKLGYRDGLPLALEALNFDQPRQDESEDPPAEQILRVRQLAIAALGRIGDRSALPALREIALEDPDPRVQTAAARAILSITERTVPAAVPVD